METFLVHQIVEVNAAPFVASPELNHDWYQCKILDRTTRNDHSSYLVEKLEGHPSQLWVDEKWIRNLR